MTRTEKTVGFGLFALVAALVIGLNAAALGLIFWGCFGGPVWLIPVGAGWLGLGMLNGACDREGGRELSTGPPRRLNPTAADKALARYLAADPADPTATLRYLDAVDPVGLPEPEASITALSLKTGTLAPSGYLASDGLDTYIVAGETLDSTLVRCEDEGTPNKEAA